MSNPAWQPGPLNVHFRRAWWKTAGMIFICAAFVSTGVLMLRDHFVFAVVGIAFFGSGVLIGLWELFDLRPLIIVNDTGIYYRAIGMIAWDDIERADFQTVQGHMFLCLWLFDPEPYFDRKSSLRRAIDQINRHAGYGHVSIPLMFLQDSPLNLVEFVLKRVGLEVPTEFQPESTETRFASRREIDSASSGGNE